MGGAVVLALRALIAAAPVVVLEHDVAPFRAAAEAAERRLPGAQEVDPADPALADKLKDASVVVAVGRKSLKAAREHVSAKPVIFCMVLGVSRMDLSGTVTGVPLEADPAAVLNQILTVLPHAKHVGLIFDPHASGLYLEHARAAAAAKGITLVLAPVSKGTEARDAFDAMVHKVDVLWLPPDPKLFTEELATYVLSEAAENKVPLVSFVESHTAQGALAAVSASFADVGDRAGQVAAGIAALPEDKRIPVPPPLYAPGELSLNLKSANALGIDVPPDAVSHAGSRVYR
ncbi:MAG: hypothetical protein JST54_28410 [Deltaproteobacteria bacterium]|nr:hypothetical protein [Deltaproteobacteria bacterium]